MLDMDLLRSAMERAFVLPASTPHLTLEPLPDSSASRAAIRRCRAAWKRFYELYFEKNRDTFLARSHAANEAAPAYCAAMPALDSFENIRDFVACTAHGILIGAIPAQRSGQLLYAAQIALSFHQCQAKVSDDPQKRPTPPPPSEKPPRVKPNSKVSEIKSAVCKIERVAK